MGEGAGWQEGNARNRRDERTSPEKNVSLDPEGETVQKKRLHPDLLEGEGECGMKRRRRKGREKEKKRRRKGRREAEQWVTNRG